MALSYEPHLMRLSDDIILQIMSYLKLKDILSLAQVCTRLEKISKDRTLWKEADLRHVFLTHSELEEAVKCFHRGTKVLASTGSVKSLSSKDTENIECLSPSLFELVTQATNLETLILEEHFINASVLTYRCFPHTIKHLSMENCQLINVPVKESYFFNMASQTAGLESLNLSGCTWFEDHSMMAISKCPRLKSLRLRNCPKVGTCAAYIFLSARFGFEKIEVLDLRETAISDAEVRAFKSKPHLRRLYVDGRLHRRQNSDEIDRISDSGLNLTEDCTPLMEVLTVTNTEVTDITLRHIARNMPNLRLIDLRSSRVTESGVIRLKTEFPLLKVVSDFAEWTTDLALVPDDWWIDRDDFVQQIEVPKPPISVFPPEAVEGEAGPSRHERIEIIAVEPGMVRLRRVFNGHPLPQVANPVPHQLDFAQPPPPPPSSPPHLDNPVISPSAGEEPKDESPQQASNLTPSSPNTNPQPQDDLP